MASSLFPQSNPLQANPQMVKIREMMKLAKSSNNPQAFMHNMISQNPQMKQVMEFVNQSGGDPQKAFYSLAQQRGIDPNQVLEFFK